MAASLAGLLAGDVVTAARGLLGVRLVRDGPDGRRVGLIVEVEAYAGREDTASHARSGRTARNAAMFGPPGRAYVYGVYGMHTCLNVVTGPAGSPTAILVRSALPLAGEAAMRDARRARAIATRRADLAAPDAAARRIAAIPTARLAMGPGNLCAAFSIALDDDGCDLLDPTAALRLEPAPERSLPGTIVAGPRVGVAYAGGGWAERPWRFRLVETADLPARAPETPDALALAPGVPGAPAARTQARAARHQSPATPPRNARPGRGDA